MSHAWPGNVRELRNIADRFVLGLWDGDPEFQGTEPSTRTLEEQVTQFERYLIQEALEACGGNASAAAERLRIPRKTLYDKIRRLGPIASAGPRGETQARMQRRA